MLLVEVIGGPDADAAAARLGVLDSVGLLRVGTRRDAPACPSVAGLVIAAPSALTRAARAELETVADLILGDREPLAEQLTRLYDLRIAPFAAGLTGEANLSSAAVLLASDPRWPAAADRYLARLRTALDAVGPADDSDASSFEHIGSTSVPGLSAKPIVDLQIQLSELRHDAAFDAALNAVGFRPAEGSRPDSPGVYRDMPRGSDPVADHVWDKRLFIRPDPGQPAILHIRQARSPWARYTILFRDWLRHHPAERIRYEQTKVQLAQAHSTDPDYDDYTRAKTVYFDGVQAQFERFGAETGDRWSVRPPVDDRSGPPPG